MDNQSRFREKIITFPCLESQPEFCYKEGESWQVGCQKERPVRRNEWLAFVVLSKKRMLRMRLAVLLGIQSLL
jgi:hypothetical protein